MNGVMTPTSTTLLIDVVRCYNMLYIYQHHFSHKTKISLTVNSQSPAKITVLLVRNGTLDPGSIVVLRNENVWTRAHVNTRVMELTMLTRIYAHISTMRIPHMDTHTPGRKLCNAS